MRMAIVDAGNDLVVNVIEADADFDPGAGMIAVPSETANIGDSYDGVNFIPPPPAPYEMTEAVLYSAISDVCPVISVTVIDGTDRATWSFVPAPEATAQQIADANNVIATIPLAPPKTVAPSDWIGRFTNAEYRAATAQTWRQTAGNAKNWDVVAFAGSIKMSKKSVTTLRTSLVADGILTETRASEIFS